MQCSGQDPAAHGEPLYLDVCTSLQKAKCTANVINGRYGLSSKDFTPGMVDAIYQNLRSRNPKHPFTVGLDDDVTHYSLPFGRLETVPETTKQCIFWGFGSDGTVGANKNTIKIIAQNTPLYAQGYFKYDALKSGSKDKCIQCNVCSAICPHAVIRPFLLSNMELQKAPSSFDARKATGGNTYAGLHFRIQASPNDCTGCEVCTNACPVGALSMMPRLDTLEKGHGANWDYAMSVPNRGQRFDANTLKGSQFQDHFRRHHDFGEKCRSLAIMEQGRLARWFQIQVAAAFGAALLGGFHMLQIRKLARGLRGATLFSKTMQSMALARSSTSGSDGASYETALKQLSHELERP
eukprot:g13297.t1